MKITVYTITDCQYSKAEKDYLASHTLPNEEKNLETNKEFLTEMMTLSNNFAGTPVTKVEKDDGIIVVLKGFTPEEFNKTFGFEATQPAPTPVVENPVSSVPASPPAGGQPPASSDDPLKSVLDTLEDKAQPVSQAPSGGLAEPVQPEATPVANSPVAETPPIVPPENPVSNTPAPSIPDFQPTTPNS